MKSRNFFILAAILVSLISGGCTSTTQNASTEPATSVEATPKEEEIPAEEIEYTGNIEEETDFSENNSNREEFSLPENVDEPISRNRDVWGPILEKESRLVYFEAIEDIRKSRDSDMLFLEFHDLNQDGKEELIIGVYGQTSWLSEVFSYDEEGVFSFNLIQKMNPNAIEDYGYWNSVAYDLYDNGMLASDAKVYTLNFQTHDVDLLYEVEDVIAAYNSPDVLLAYQWLEQETGASNLTRWKSEEELDGGVGIYDHTYVAGRTVNDLWDLGYLIGIDGGISNAVQYLIFPTDAKASSTLADIGGRGYDAANAIDGSPFTTWCEGAEGNGIGEYLELTVAAGTELHSVYITPGYVRTEELFTKNAMPKTVKLTTGGQEIILNLQEYNPYAYYKSMENTRLYPEYGHRIVFGTPLVSDGAVRVEIMDVRDGSMYQDACITDVFFD